MFSCTYHEPWILPYACLGAICVVQKVLWQQLMPNLDVVRVCWAIMAALIILLFVVSVDGRTHLVMRVGVGKAQHIIRATWRFLQELNFARISLRQSNMATNVSKKCHQGSTSLKLPKSQNDDIYIQSLSSICLSYRNINTGSGGYGFELEGGNLRWKYLQASSWSTG